MRNQDRNRTRRHTALLLTAALLLSLACALLLPAAAAAQETERQTVRVGWHEPPYFITDQLGRRSGYSYEYQRKVAAYTGWKYEYVPGGWSELLQMLKNGELDVLANVSYMEERAADMLFTSLPMGTEVYYLFVAPDNAEITQGDYASLNGRRVGVARDSIQCDLFLRWEEMHGVSAELVELTSTEEESRCLLGTELDAFVTMDIHADSATNAPVWKIGSSDFYFAVSKTRPDLLVQLNAALNRIQDENKYYNQQLHEKYLGNTETELYLTGAEKAWLLDHGPIRVGYQDNYLAFCAADESTGRLTGALRDYLDYAAGALENGYLEFETQVYPSAAAALEALKNGEVDCMFPANLNENDAEQLGVVMTPPLMRTEMDAVVRAAEQKEFVRKQDVVVAVNRGNTNYDMFLGDHYPGWQRAYFTDTPAGLEAVADGKADCVIISNYRFSNISRLCDRLHLTTVYTGVDMDYSFAVREGDAELYSILARVNKAVPDAAVHTALTYYSTEDVRTSFTDLVRDHLFIVMSVIAAILLVILVLLLRSIRAKRILLEEEHLVDDLNKRVYVDALTSVRNKAAFDEYTRGLQERLTRGEQTEFAIGVFDCDNLKLINDQNGHDKGNLYLKAASRLICTVFHHSPVFRIGGDEFTVVLEGEDYVNREALVRAFREKQAQTWGAGNKWDQVHVALGLAVYDPENDSSVNDTVRRADKLMYDNKRRGKQS